MSWDSGPGTSSGSGWSSSGWSTPDASPADSVDMTPTSAPLHWLLLGIAVAGAGVALPLFDDSIPTAAVGWALGGVVALLLWGVFVVRDGARRAQGFALVSTAAKWLGPLLVVLAAGAVAINAWAIADELARRPW